MISVITRDGKTSVVLKGAIGIQEAVTLRQKLSSALQEAEELLLDLKQVESLDISSMQLIWTAALTAKKKGKKLRFSVRSTDIFAGLIIDSGFSRFFLPAARTK